MPECRDCGASVRWASTPKGKKVMLEVEPELWSIEKKLWRIEPGPEGMDGTPITLLEVEDAGGEIEGYAVHWDVCGMDREETPRDQLQTQKTAQRVSEAPRAQPDAAGNKYGNLYGKAPTSQHSLFDVDAPVKASGALFPRLRQTIAGWREMADRYEAEAAQYNGSMKLEKQGVAENLRLCAAELESVLG